jgi:2-keto-4-pentenoate hydratase
MTPDAVDAAARHLVAARLAGKPGLRLPESCRPATSDEAVTIQRRVAEVLGEPIGGWKCSLPNPQHLVVAPIFASNLYRTSPCAMPVNAGIAAIEPEVAFVLGRDLPPRVTPYSDDEVRGAIAEARLVLELLTCRYADPASATILEIVADSLKDYGLYLGPVLDDAFTRPLATLPITVAGPDGTILTRDGKHNDGHPLRPLVWLANWLADNPVGWTRGLRAGDVITTGSYAGALDVPAGIPLRVVFGDLGTITAEFVAL